MPKGGAIAGKVEIKKGRHLRWSHGPKVWGTVTRAADAESRLGGAPPHFLALLQWTSVVVPIVGGGRGLCRPDEGNRGC